MTLEDKARELFIKYGYAIRTEETHDGYFTNIPQAKQCTLIAVDEIINNGCFDEELKYWQEVKQEIEKL